ncbi:MAG: hypothetical protein FWH38_08370 [Treponema sp.]|nr:hypothetical protein [Treponema sp.]
MINRRPYIAETAIKPGCAVVQGSADNKVRAPDSEGKGNFIGLYPFEANETKAPNEEIGIVLHGVAKAVAGGPVAAGKKAILKADESGSLVVLPDAAGKYSTVGIFLEGGSSGDYVDVLIERGNIKI